MPQHAPRPQATHNMIAEAAAVVASKIDADAGTIAQYYCHPMDGFELCIELIKSAYWEPSRDDMEALDEMEVLVRKALREEQARWASEFDQDQLAPEGSRIRCQTRDATGTVIGMGGSTSPGTYLVRPDHPVGNESWLVPWELAEILA